MKNHKIFGGHWYDGISSKAHPAELLLDEHSLTIKTQNTTRGYSLEDAYLEPIIPSLPAKISFKDSSCFIFNKEEDISSLTAILQHRQGGQWIRHLEKSFKIAILSLVFLIFILYTFITYGIPALANPLSKYIPQHWVEQLDYEILELLIDSNLVEGPELKKYQGELNTYLLEMNIDPAAYNVKVFRSKIGANALALPGGTIIVTRKFMKLDMTEREIKSVLAHEVGHIENRHGLRGMIQNISVTAVLGMLLGDVSAFAQLALVSAPIMLQTLSYTRDFEREADRYSISILEQNGIPTSCLSSSLRKLESSHRNSNKNNEQSKANVLFDILSTHPSTDERASYAENSAPCN